MCGEYVHLSKASFEMTGSPPHVLRILHSANKNAAEFRITSTCVENTFKSSAFWCDSEDHLHMCGEYPIYVFPSSANVGSPPHVWRILKLINELGKIIGITSTCVENTVMKGTKMKNK